MEPDVFLQQPMSSIVGILCSFEDEQYLSNSINPLCLITKYPNEGIGFLVGFGKVMQYPIMCEKICYGTQCIFGIPQEGYYRCIE
jgi:hypothetical protein